MEVEVKFRIDKLDEIEEKVKKMARFVTEKIERDLYFNFLYKDFKESDEALRIRSDVEGVTITYKSPKLDDETKSREEIKIKIDSYENGILLLKKLGFVPIGEVVKKRRIYKIDDALICLDNVEELGNFVEIEIETSDFDIAKEKVLEIAKILGFNVKQSIRTSYLEMLEAMKRN
jgi:adenylate cyclase class 2